MERRTSFAIILSLAVVSFFVLATMAEAGAEKEPIWNIFEDGTDKSVNWKPWGPNPRFAIFDPQDNGDDCGDLVLDKETGLVWMRCPESHTVNWIGAVDFCYQIPKGINRFGWRLPAAAELNSLGDPDGPNALPLDHPFLNVPQGFYWSSTTRADDPTRARGMWFDHDTGEPSQGPYKTDSHYFWCVRGGKGNDNI